MSDLISRQEAIDTIKQLYIDLATQKYVIDLLKVLPSVTPQETVLDKIRAEIKHFMYNINPSSSESDYACNYILNIIDKYKEK